jgi:hypothetical protein
MLYPWENYLGSDAVIFLLRNFLPFVATISFLVWL